MTTAKISDAPTPVPSRKRSWRGAVIITACVLLAMLILGHRFIPNIRGLGSMIDSVAPLFGLAVPVLAIAASVRRSGRALAMVLLPTLVWVALYGDVWLPPQWGQGDGPTQLRVISQNLYAGNPDPATTIAALAETGADLIALQEAKDGTLDSLGDAVKASHPYQEFTSTVGLLSRYPITSVKGVDTGLDWTRALRAEVQTPDGTVAVYVVHLGSARINATATRDHTVTVLAEVIRADKAARVVVLGDLNTATTDREISPLHDLLGDAQADAGWGFGFTWPSSLPIMRPDHVLYRGLTTTGAQVIRTPGTDHRAVAASFSLT